MDFYDPALTAQLAPLVAFALGSGECAAALQKHLDRAQLAHSIWDNSIIKNRLSATRFRLQYVASESAIEAKIKAHKSTAADTHSPFSPLNSSSDLFPSGVMSSNWFRKYTCDIPFAVVCVYDLHSDRENDTSLAEELAAARRKYLGYNVRFVAIVVSSGDHEIADRLAQLRQISGLANLSGLFHVTKSSNLDADCDVLASSVLNALKTSATDFYSSIEFRVKQRFKKYYKMPRSEIKTSIELSPKILETRNLIKQGILLQLMHPHNVEASLPVLEQCYESLLDLTSKNASHFFSKSRTGHDRKVYVQWRTLLDAIAVHIVRGYFSIEEPVLAMRKHKNHISAVAQLLATYSQPGVKLWIATQHHWLAELMVLVPESILSGLRANATVKGKKQKDSTEYVGGLLFPDRSVVVTNPIFLYKVAANELSVVDESEIHSEIFTDHFANIQEVVAYKIKLLDSARQCITSSETTPLGSLEVLLLCEAGDCYLSLNDQARAIHFYELAQKKCVSPSWHSVYRLVTQKIMSAAKTLADSQKTLKQLASLSMVGAPPVASLENVDFTDCSVVDLDNQFPFVRVDVCLFNKSLRDEVRVADTIVSQFRIESVFDAAVLEKAIPGSKVAVSLNYIDVKYENSSVRLSGKGKQSGHLQMASAENDEAAFNFSEFGENGLVLQLNNEATSTGSFSVSELNVSLTVKVDVNGKEITINKDEVVTMDHSQIRHTFDLYVEDSIKGLYKKKKDLKGRNACRLFVKPYRPEVELKTESTPRTIIVGEKFETPITLAFPETYNASTDCKSVKLLVETIVYDDMIETKALHAQVSWDQMKDDEPMELLEAIQKNAREQKHKLHVKITRSPSSTLPEKDLKVVVYFKLQVTSAAEVSEYDVTHLDVDILPAPFSHTLQITPSIHENGVPSIPNPFVLTDGDALSMPSLSRSWLMHTTVEDIHELLVDNLKITRAKLHVRSSNPEITTNWLDETSSKERTYSRKFMTSGRHRPTTTSVTIVASVSFFYERKDSEIESLYETEEQEVVVPLQDPRVLLQVNSDEKVHLCFIIENPTSRIFTFASTLNTDRAVSRGVVWDFDDEKNDSPLKQTIIPVLPFSQHTVEYYASYSVEETPKAIELPQLQVFDMHYKVSLPTIPLQSCVLETESGMVLEL